MCPDSSLLKTNKTVQMFNISVDFKDTKKVDHILESSLDFQTVFDAINVIYVFYIFILKFYIFLQYSLIVIW